MSDDRALRQELETLQHRGKELRVELGAPQSPSFVIARDTLRKQLLEGMPVLAREEKAASTATAREAELRLAVERTRVALQAAEQRRLSPALGLVPVVAFCLLSSWAMQGDTLLQDRGFVRLLATLSTAAAGFILGGRWWTPRAIVGPQAPFPVRVWQALSKHLFFNPSAWAPLSFAVSCFLLVACTAQLSPIYLLSFVDLALCQMAALVTFALASRSLSSDVVEHHGYARVEAMLGGAVLLGTTLWGWSVLFNQWFDGGGALTKAALGVALAGPLVAAAGWLWVVRGKRPLPTPLWLVPTLVSVAASLVLMVDTHRDDVESVEATSQALEYSAAQAPRAPFFLVRDEAELGEARRMLGEIPPPPFTTGDTGGEALEQTRARLGATLKRVTTRLSVDVSAFLLSAQFALISLLSAWFFARATGPRRWLARALPLLPVVVLVVAVFHRGA